MEEVTIEDILVGIADGKYAVGTKFKSNRGRSIVIDRSITLGKYIRQLPTTQTFEVLAVVGEKWAEEKAV